MLFSTNWDTRLTLIADFNSQTRIQGFLFFHGSVCIFDEEAEEKKTFASRRLEGAGHSEGGGEGGRVERSSCM